MLVLGSWRAVFGQFPTTPRLEPFLRCHVHAFEAFGGSPRGRLDDHATTVVLARPDLRAAAPSTAPHWHPQCLDFAGDYGVTPRLCRPYRARPKGTVERLLRSVRERFFAGCPCVDLTDLNRQVALWGATVAHARVHATTGEGPAIRLARERLLPLTGRPPDATTLGVPRRLSSGCMVAYAGHLSSVPSLSGGHQVPLRIREAPVLLEIGAEDRCLARHSRLAGHGRRSLQPEPLSGLGQLTLQGTGQRPLPPASPPPARAEAPGPLHLPGVAARPAVAVRPLTASAALGEEVPA